MKKLFTILLFMLTIGFAVNSQAQCNAYFTYTVDSTGYGVQFTDYSYPDSLATIVSWSWDFGNGQTSTQQNPYFTFNDTMKIVCLTIYTDDSCYNTYCDTVFTSQSPCANFYATTSVTNETSAGNDGAIDLTVYGGTQPYVYSWSNGATTQNISGLSAGSYTVSVTDSIGCSLIETAYVYLDSTYMDSIYSQIDTCLGGFIDSVNISNINMIDSNHAEITYILYSGNNSATVTAQYIINGTGWYWAILNVTCNGTKAGQTFEQAVYISATTNIIKNKITNIKLYPNPVKDNMFIDFKSNKNAKTQISITNIMGQNIFSKDISLNKGSNKIIIPTTNLKKGIYFVNIYTNSNSKVTLKFVK